MNTELLLALLALIMIGTYFQTVTGFGLGIIVIGAATALDLASVHMSAAVVSLVTLVNCAIALPGARKHIDWQAIKFVLIGVVPGIIIGVLLLGLLSASATNMLQGLLGSMIVYSGLSLFLSPQKQTTRSGNMSFLVSGLGSGLTGGMFGMSGPPIVYQFYRQPFEINVIRNMLLAVFVCTSASRSLFVGVQGELDQDILLLSACALPVVALSTVLGRRFPPPLSQQAMRRMVFFILMLIGLYLIVKAVMGALA